MEARCRPTHSSSECEVPVPTVRRVGFAPAVWVPATTRTHQYVAKTVQIRWLGRPWAKEQESQDHRLYRRRAFAAVKPAATGLRADPCRGRHRDFDILEWRGDAQRQRRHRFRSSAPVYRIDERVGQQTPGSRDGRRFPEKLAGHLHLPPTRRCAVHPQGIDGRTTITASNTLFGMDETFQWSI